ncbi:hypothetical protein M9Y10_040618 [Tritrichomonas musculus]|uniref:Uncharacterized protein n=1 Tax=Tritrichomonas musculus TaxID=1915356 RepID=A0ABR2GPC3_9EUKA
MESRTFESCYSLRQVLLPASLNTIISGHVFSNYASLEKVSLPSSIKCIDICLFRNSSSQKQVDERIRS